MHKRSVLLFLGSILFGLSLAQEKKEILLSIDGDPVYVSEFNRIYRKNIDLVKDDAQKDVDEYLNLFINYKLKLKEAEALGLDQKETYIRELQGYQKQLASNYLTDTKTSEALIKEAYERSLERVKASHVLIMVKPNASAKDTMRAYQKILAIKDELASGQKFEEVAKKYSEDPSVVKNEGNLGWFSVFRMVYPFENTAYQTKVGEISTPFRTQFGYHILQVQDREKKLGEVTVAHIMVAINDNRTSEEAKIRLQQIKQQIAQGASFSSLAKTYSDDPSTAIEGGKIRRFAQGALNSEKFEKAAFALQQKGELSPLVKTRYGWHIIKLIERHPVKTYQELKNDLTTKVKRDSRSKLVTRSFIHMLKDKYGIAKNEEAIAYFKNILPDSIFYKPWKIPADKQLEKELFTIKKEVVLYRDFAEFILQKKIREATPQDISIFVEDMYQQFESSTLLSYYESHLEEDNADFANIINEYREGLLLFDLMESKIWNAATTDSLALQKFYEENKDNYKQKERYTVLKASSSKPEVIDTVRQLLENNTPLEEIKKKVNKGDGVLVIFSEDSLEKGANGLPKGFSDQNSNMMITEEDNLITLIMIKETVPSRTKTFKETKGEVINDFQESIENRWLDQLRVKYAVKINNKVLKKVKKELVH
ncbi:peptidylprolyl isomerase [Aquimarina sp. U1-2]|uniref:peptidylprolyl isomerase n=1 Tax=Aquimarina sp. U1-2 TaxID=2823141 RepID=UPI001AEC8C17|nr:peptidylprolyl isomerase [Aquimarina sp. U1-2]MBP2832301.1 peptidylprolyl isomerase [Aquimarina sp. U1-2]